MVVSGPEPGGRGYWRVAIVEDHLLQRERTEEILDAADGLRVVGSFDTLPEFVAWSRSVDSRRRPHLLVLDLVVDRRPPVDPADVRRLVDDGLRVLVLSAMASPRLVREVLHAGVTGVVGKRDSAETVLEAVWAVLRRERWMSPELAGIIAGDAERPRLSIQEERALTLYASGLTLNEVSSVMNVKPDTAKSYLARVKKKYAEVGRPVRSKIDLSRAANQDGLLE
jgi:DNA-binding NarL/FixJ family response regulator